MKLLLRGKRLDVGLKRSGWAVRPGIYTRNPFRLHRYEADGWEYGTLRLGVLQIQWTRRVGPMPATSGIGWKHD